MNGSKPQSWFDLPVMPPMDPRSIISTASFEDLGGTMRAATFERSSTFLAGALYVVSPLSVTTPGSGTTPYVSVPNTYDYGSIEEANTWNTLHMMTIPTPATMPLSVQKIMFLHAGTAFVNNIFLDCKAGTTSTNVQLTFRDNSVTSGDFQNAG